MRLDGKPIHKYVEGTQRDIQIVQTQTQLKKFDVAIRARGLEDDMIDEKERKTNARQSIIL